MGKRTFKQWITGLVCVFGGAVSIGLSDLADAVGHVGDRIYLPGGNHAWVLGLILIGLGALLTLPAVLAEKSQSHLEPPPPPKAPSRESQT
jgi:hypothetical protein